MRSKLKGKKAKETKKPISPELGKNAVNKIEEIIVPICEAEEIELIQVEYQQEKTGRVLRLYIDKPGGVTLEDCAHISRQIEDVLEIYIEDKSSYHLEVSSPGSNRPLVKQKDFVRFQGNTAKIRPSSPFEGRRNFQGVLSGVTEKTVKIVIDDKTFIIPFQDIAKAHLVNYSGEN